MDRNGVCERGGGGREREGREGERYTNVLVLFYTNGTKVIFLGKFQIATLHMFQDFKSHSFHEANKIIN